MNKEELVGQVFGDYMVLEYNEEASKSQKDNIYKCQCMKCGNITNKRRKDLLADVRTTCKICNLPETIDEMVGQRFGLLKVIGYDYEMSNLLGKTMYECRCDGTCGGEIISVNAYELKTGVVTGCSFENSGKYSKNAIPMIDKVFNGLKVIDIDQESSSIHKGRDLWYICECEKGHKSSHNGALLRKNTEECPFCHPKMKGKHSKKGMESMDLTGKRFGSLTVLHDMYTDFGEHMWYCSCTYPGDSHPHSHLSVYTEYLLSGLIYACPDCMDKSMIETTQKFYKEYYFRISNMFYNQIKSPCIDESHPTYCYFGGCGVECKYENMEDFYYDYLTDYNIAENRYGAYTLVPDTIDAEGDFEKGNIRFVYPHTRDINHRPIDRYYVLYNQLWTSEMLSEFAGGYLGFYINPWFIDERIKNGQTAAEALQTDLDGNKIKQIPILDINVLKRAHKVAQHLHHNDVDYLFNNTPYEIFPKDKFNIVRFNKMLHESGQI